MRVLTDHHPAAQASIGTRIVSKTAGLRCLAVLACMLGDNIRFLSRLPRIMMIRCPGYKPFDGACNSAILVSPSVVHLHSDIVDAVRLVVKTQNDVGRGRGRRSKTQPGRELQAGLHQAAARIPGVREADQGGQHRGGALHRTIFRLLAVYRQMRGAQAIRRAAIRYPLPLGGCSVVSTALSLHA